MYIHVYICIYIYIYTNRYIKYMSSLHRLQTFSYSSDQIKQDEYKPRRIVHVFIHIYICE